jgi:predicted Mrr-cat superfamily restriction endonuclease
VNRKRTVASHERLEREARVTRAALDMSDRIDALLVDPKKNPLPLPEVVVPIALSLCGMLAGPDEDGDAIRRCAGLRFDKWLIETTVSQIDAAMNKNASAKTNAKKERAT